MRQSAACTEDRAGSRWVRCAGASAALTDLPNQPLVLQHCIKTGSGAVEAAMTQTVVKQLTRRHANPQSCCNDHRSPRRSACLCIGARWRPCNYTKLLHRALGQCSSSDAKNERWLTYRLSNLDLSCPGRVSWSSPISPSLSLLHTQSKQLINHDMSQQTNSIVCPDIKGLPGRRCERLNLPLNPR